MTGDVAKGVAAVKGDATDAMVVAVAGAGAAVGRTKKQGLGPAFSLHIKF